MILHSKIKEVLTENVNGDVELLKKIANNGGAIERKIDGMLNKEDADIDNAIEEAKGLIEILFGGIWISKNWHNVEKNIRKKIESSKW